MILMFDPIGIVFKQFVTKEKQKKLLEVTQGIQLYDTFLLRNSQTAPSNG